MQYEIRDTPYAVQLSSSKIDVDINAEAPLEIILGQSAKMEAKAAINYIKSGAAEINAAVTAGIDYFDAHAAEVLADMANKSLSNLNAVGEAKFTAKQDALISGTNIKTVNGTTLLGSGDLSIATSNCDDVSINHNSSDKLQAVGIINQNETSTALKSWSGTKAEYDAIVTKDSNTLYHITDDESDISQRVAGIINSIYPVGSIYLTVSNDNPATLLGLGTWQKVASGRVLQGADNDHAAGTTIAAGLPNIEGSFGGFNTGLSGCYYSNNESTGQGWDGYEYKVPKKIYSDASRSSSVYGNSDTVQPPAFVVNIWQRIA